MLDLRTPDGADVFRELVKDADVVIEAMRPGGLAKRGLGYDDLKAVNPRIVWCTISGYGMTGPYKDMPSHGIAYDTWAGLVKPETDDDGFCYIPEHPSIGIHAGPLFGALGVLAGVIGARSSGEGYQMEIAQSDAAAAMDWLRSETWKAYERPDDEVTGNPSDDFERRAPGTAGMRDGVRYQFYATSDDRHVLFMASEQEFWKNFCDGIGRPELFERWPGSQYGDHAKGNRELQRILKDVFAERTAAEWIAFGGEHNTPIAPVNTPKTIAEDPSSVNGSGSSAPTVSAPNSSRRRSSWSTRICRCRPRHPPSASTPTRCSANYSATTTVTSRNSGLPGRSGSRSRERLRARPIGSRPRGRFRYRGGLRSATAHRAGLHRARARHARREVVR
ncbi:MAG: CoA transferase [Microthrixaceae bacterium]